MIALKGTRIAGSAPREDVDAELAALLDRGRRHALVTAEFSALRRYLRCARSTMCAAMSGTLSSRKFCPAMNS